MADEHVQIAARIRELREILEIQTNTLADRLGLSLADYLAHESGEKDIPISTLYAIAAEFGVDFSVLLTGETPRMDTHCIVRAGQGIHIDRFEGYEFESLAFNFKHRTMEPMLVTLMPKEKRAPLVTHGGQEFNLVLEGKLIVILGAREHILETGDSIYFNPQIPHGQHAIDGKAKFLTMIQE